MTRVPSMHVGSATLAEGGEVASENIYEQIGSGQRFLLRCSFYVAARKQTSIKCFI